MLTGAPITKRVELRNGRTVLIGPLQPSDRERFLSGLRRTSAESMYRRFMTPMVRLTASQIVYLIDVDHHDHEALLAVDEDSGEAVAVGRFVREEPSSSSAEAAVLVVDDWQGHGLGSAICRAMSDRARELGVERFEATMLSDNEAMMRVFSSLGEPQRVATDGTTVTLSLILPDPMPTEEITGSLKPVTGDRFELSERG